MLNGFIISSFSCIARQVSKGYANFKKIGVRQKAKPVQLCRAPGLIASDKSAAMKMYLLYELIPYTPKLYLFKNYQECSSTELPESDSVISKHCDFTLQNEMWKVT
ncbi:unnamed protein product [Acanthoscelides obtectus]|uniref:Uncharacterized protein n=1 Tax=Acanthoscelides obtectus TaxID=200917 RepID=A0A9P0PN62_ACAOB|nr:unnamed protein product [Acanthoscelides obtectus]CAK1664571.1 hypothetical protein AOBTE_LOCUS24341 [Acanthoscelides obtectus]